MVNCNPPFQKSVYGPGARVCVCVCVVCGCVGVCEVIFILVEYDFV